ncbi:MAG: orotidine 5'-phosphate decarboxylase [Candidatus Hermodarchaeota archaeon]
MTKSFLSKFQTVYEEKKSILCVGLDVAVLGQRPSRTIPPETDRLDFMLDLLEKVSPYCMAVKPNRQYVLGLTTAELSTFNKKVHELGLISIIDHKLSDIGSTNDSALFWINKEGFDALTFSPFAGNTRGAAEKAHEYGLGLIVLTLMSNPEAKWMITESINGKLAYRFYAEEVQNWADVAVVGATGHVKLEHIKEIKQIIGNKLILAPGVGAQGGDAEKLIQICGSELLINVGRAIIYDPDPAKKAKEFNDLFNNSLKK